MQTFKLCQDVSIASMPNSVFRITSIRNPDRIQLIDVPTGKDYYFSQEQLQSAQILSAEEFFAKLSEINK